jgi:hypothetical protein
MARMLGRWLAGGCGCGRRLKFRQPLGPDCCGHGSDPRRFKRIEQRETERELAEDLADAATARAARASIAAGEPVVPWEQVRAEAGQDDLCRAWWRTDDKPGHHRCRLRRHNGDHECCCGATAASLPAGGLTGQEPGTPW